MVRKYTKTLAAFFLLFVFIFPSDTTEAATEPLLEVGEVRSLGESVRVPIVLHDMDYLTSAQIAISLPAESHGVTLKAFEPGSLFNGDVFRTTGNITDNQITIDFISQTAKYVQMSTYGANKSVVIGYLTYDLSEEFSEGTTVPLQITKVIGQGRYGDILFRELDGEIEHKMPIGDVVGEGKVTVTGAMRILQHLNGDFITNEEERLSADVDADGQLTQVDAQQILDYVTGKRTSFLAVAAKDLSDGVLQSEYREKIEARHGREPYQYKYKTGSMPYGLTLNAETGELTGVPKREGTFAFDIEATDAAGNKAVRKFTLNIINSNIASVETTGTYQCKTWRSPNLPSQVKVTYKDKTTSMENVTWEPVDTSNLGIFTVKGTIGDTGFTVKATVKVINENYISHIQIGYVQFLNVFTIVLDTTPEVYTVTVNDISAHYEGNGQFSLASASFEAGTDVTLRLYDKYGNLLETKAQKLELN